MPSPRGHSKSPPLPRSPAAPPPRSPPNYLSPKDLGLAIGVSESSIKRWVDAGEVATVRTTGGHRRIRLQEAIRFIRRGGHSLAHPELLGLPPRGRNPERMTAPERSRALLRCLLNGELAEARGHLVHAYVSEGDIVLLGREILQPALARIGELWLSSPVGIAVEHAAVETCLLALHQISRMLPDAEGPLALGGSPAGDPYQIGSLLVAMTLQSEGMRTVNLGANVPFPAFSATIERHAPALAWLSVSVPDQDGSLSADLRRVAVELAARGTRLVVGGRAAQTIRADGDGALLVTDNLAQAQAIGRELAAPTTRR